MENIKFLKDKDKKIAPLVNLNYKGGGGSPITPKDIIRSKANKIANNIIKVIESKN